jgi:hypothetical protein
MKSAVAFQRRLTVKLDALEMEVDALEHLQAETAAELDATTQLIWGAHPPRVRWWAPSPTTGRLGTGSAVRFVSTRSSRPARAPVETREGVCVPRIQLNRPGLDALLPATLPPSLSFGGTGDRAFKGEL